MRDIVPKNWKGVVIVPLLLKGKADRGNCRITEVLVYLVLRRYMPVFMVE